MVLWRSFGCILAAGYSPRDSGMRGIGYREILEMRSGCETLTGVRQRIARSTRRYAKRQLTFFRSVKGVTWMHPDLLAAVRQKVDAFLATGT